MPVQYCTTHKDRETLRICGRCERPFCSDCLVVTPVGGRCRDCARGPRIARLRVDPWRWPLIAVTAAACGVAGGLVFSVASWFFILIALAAGQIIAGAVLPVSGRKPGTVLALVAASFVFLGVFGAGAVDGVFMALREAAESGPVVLAAREGLRDGFLTPWNWIGAAIMAGSTYMRLR